VEREDDNYFNMQTNANVQSQQFENMNRLMEQNVSTSMLEGQLNLKEELNMIENLLRSKVKIFNEEKGEEEWVVPKDSSEILLSEYGINLIMKRVRMYLNKNTLLSNYETETIYEKMEDFSNSLNDEIFMKYELVFKFPNSKEIQDELIKKINIKVDNTAFNMELKGLVPNKDEIRKQIISEMDIEKERNKTKEALFKNKLKSFEGLIRSIQDSIHSAYLRAWNGGERRSLRKTMSVSEVINPAMMKRNNGGGLLGIFGK